MTIVILIILLFLSSILSAIETAFTGASANKIRLKYLAENGSKSAGRALKIAENYEKMLTTVLLGNNVLNLTLSSLATLFVLRTLPLEIGEKYGALISTAVVTIAVVMFGEIIPKTIASIHIDKLCMLLAPLMSFLMIVLTPFSAAFLLIQKAVTKIFSKDYDGATYTKEEFVHLIGEIEDKGVIEERESELIRNAAEFEEKTAGEILTPRVSIAAVPLSTPPEKVREIFLSEGYSRLPVYDKTIDKICGILNFKDFVRELEANSDKTIKEIMRKPILVSSLMKISEVMALMRRQRQHIAVVLDQHGGTDGVITFEDILEELVGEIDDESDDATPLIVMKSDNYIDVSGRYARSEFNRYAAEKGFQIELTDSVNTVGGAVTALFGHIPKEGEIFKSEKYTVRVTAVHGNRVERAAIKFIP